MAVPSAMQTAVLGAAIAAELVVLVGHPLFGWGPTRRRPPVTPPALSFAPAPSPSASSVLRGLAADARRVARASPDSASTGRYAYVSLRTWRLADQLSAGGHPSRPLVRDVTTWRAATAPGRMVTVALTRGGKRTTVTTLPPSPEGDAERGLAAGASTAEAIARFVDVAAAQPIPTATEARILSALAGDAGFVDAGTSVDRAGRAAVAIAFTGPALGTEVRDTLLLDPRTGSLLEFDETLAGDPHGLPVASGAVLATTVFVGAGRVDRVGETPTPAPR